LGVDDGFFPYAVVRQLFEPALAQANGAIRDRLLSGAAVHAESAVDPHAEPGPVPLTTNERAQRTATTATLAARETPRTSALTSPMRSPPQARRRSTMAGGIEQHVGHDMRSAEELAAADVAGHRALS
jgi:hypothetical protein